MGRRTRKAKIVPEITIPSVAKKPITISETIQGYGRGSKGRQ